MNKDVSPKSSYKETNPRFLKPDGKVVIIEDPSAVFMYAGASSSTTYLPYYCRLVLAPAAQQQQCHSLPA